MVADKAELYDREIDRLDRPSKKRALLLNEPNPWSESLTAGIFKAAATGHHGALVINAEILVGGKGVGKSLLVDQLRPKLEKPGETLIEHDIEPQDQVHDNNLNQDRELFEKTIRDLHKELQKGSLRNRLSFLTSSCVLLFTGLTFMSLLGGEITLKSSNLSLFLVATVFLWILARQIPTLPEPTKADADD